MKTLWIEDEDALNVGRVIVTKTGTKDCTVCYSCDERDEYENRLKADLVAMLTEMQLEIEEEKQDTKHLHYDDLERAESYNVGIDNCIDIIQQKINSLKSESEDKKDKIMKIKFITDFAGNWKTGDIVEAKYLEDGEVLADGVAKIDIRLLLKRCKIISESEEWVNFAEDLIPIIDEVEE